MREYGTVPPAVPFPYLRYAKWAVRKVRVPASCADDAKGAALEGVARSLSTYDPRRNTSLDAWVKAGALHYVQDWRRSWFHTRRAISDFDTLEDSDPYKVDQPISDHSDGVVDRMTSLQFAREAIRNPWLSDLERGVVVRYFLDEETLLDISKDLGITVGRVSQIKSEAIHKLRSRLGIE